MALSYKEIATSKPYRFLVGSDRTEYFAHPNLVAHQSQPLAALVYGRMKEALNGCAILDDVDSETFVRFVEYIYTGEYKAAEHVVIIHASTVPQEDKAPVAEYQEDTNRTGISYAERRIDTQLPVDVDAVPVEDLPTEAAPVDDYLMSSRSRKSKKKKENAVAYSDHGFSLAFQPAPTRRTQAWSRFKGLSWSAHQDLRETCTYEPRANKEASEDYSEVFLSHAKVYVFADKYDLEKLRHLALEKLHETLVSFRLYTERVRDVALLLEYTYRNTPARDGAVDDLRALVTKYVACHVELLMHDDVVRDVLHAENASSLDLMDEILHRLN